MNCMNDYFQVDKFKDMDKQRLDKTKSNVG